MAVSAIVVLCAGALFMAASAALKMSARPGRYRAAAQLLAQQTLRTAENAWKYGSAGGAPAGSAEESMLVAGTSVPVTVSSTVVSQDANGAEIDVTVAYPAVPGGDEPGAITISGAVRVMAPLPGAQVERPGLIPQPARP